MTVPKFIAKSNAPIDRALVSGDGLVLERFRRLMIRLEASVGRDVAAVLAEPVVTRRGGDLDIAWYAAKAGEPRPLVSLDSEARGIVEKDLRNKLAALRPMLNDPEVGSLLNKSLVLRGAEDIYAIGQEAVLVNWGLLPDGIEQTDRTAIDRHFAATLGPFMEVPALAITTSGALPEDARRRGRARAGTTRGGIGLLIATGIAAVLTLLATLPGVLRPLTPAASGPSADALATQRTITEAMRKKVAQAREELRGAVCTADQPRKGAGPGGKAAPKPVDPTARINDIADQSVVYVIVEVDKAKPSAAPVVDPSGEPNAKPPSKSAFETTKPTKIADDKPKPPSGAAPAPPKPAKPDEDKGTPVSLGTGFFIGPKTVVTNRHVVENAVNITVTSRFLGGRRPAKLVAITPNSDIGQADFAVLSIDTDKQPPALPLSSEIRPLTNVVAIGFPSNITDTDPDFYRLMHGDPKAVPHVALTAGYITNIQDSDGAVPRILHSAAIAPGNSGGPLIDYCGRVLGVNTFVRHKADTYIVNQSLASRALAAFLDEKKVPYKKDEGACGVGGGALPPMIVSHDTPSDPAPGGAAP